MILQRFSTGLFRLSAAYQRPNFTFTRGIKYVHRDFMPVGSIPSKPKAYPFGYNKIHDSLPKRLTRAEEVKQDVKDRWLPAARGNLKRMRSNFRLKRSGKTSRQESRLRKPVYATRTQLRKLKKIVGNYVRKVRK